MQVVMEIKIFAIAGKTSPLRNNCTFSMLKDEKVLKPPQKPTTSSILCDSLIFPREASISTTPKTIQLNMLAVSVPIGKEPEKIRVINLPTPNRAMLPSPPPKKINK
jgi:hypothetical protein